MKNILIILMVLLATTSFVHAQTFKGLDKSPMDRAYFPDEFAHDRKFAPEKVGDKALIKLTYSRTAKNGRIIFGDLVPYDKLWRVGANEAPEIQFYEDCKLGGKSVKAGSYSLFMIPGKKTWTLVLNSDLDVWGAYSYNADKDVLRATIPAKESTATVENLTIHFKPTANGDALMQLGWDQVVVEVPISF